MATKQQRKAELTAKLETAEKRILEIRDTMVSLKNELQGIMIDVTETANKAAINGLFDIDLPEEEKLPKTISTSNVKDFEISKEKFPWLFDDVKYPEAPRHVYILMPVYKISLPVLRRNWATLTTIAQLLYGNFAEVEIVNKCPSHEINTLDELTEYQFEEYKCINKADTFVCSSTYGVWDNGGSEDDMCMRMNLTDNRMRTISKKERESITDPHVGYIKKLPHRVLIDRDFLDTVHDHSDEENKGSSSICCNCKDPQSPSPVDKCLD